MNNFTYTDKPGFTVQELSPVMSVMTESLPQESNITFHNRATGGEMLKITEDGFYVRGKRVEADEREAAAVYRAFKQWLVEAALVRN
jgi:hypothetical protein